MKKANQKRKEFKEEAEKSGDESVKEIKGKRK